MSALRSVPATETCGESRIVAGKRFVCIRMDHSWPSANGHTVADFRRRAGKPINPDKHVFVREE